MGHKVHPSGLRIGLRSNWPSKWFANKRKFADFLIEDIKIRNLITKDYEQAGVTRIEIKRNANIIDIAISTAKPGLIIGRGGAGVKDLKRKIDDIYKHLEKKIRPHIRLSIAEISNPDLSAQLIAENIAYALRKRINVRRAVNQALEKAKEKGVKGIRIKVSGRLNGADIARSEFVTYGSIPLSTFKADIDYAMIHAWTTYGTIGVKVWVFQGKEFRKR